MSQARLAIVDDDPAFAAYLATMLESRGYSVRCFATGADLISSLSHPPMPDLVLLDVLMPGMNGLETLKAARQVHPGLQVIMLSGQQVPSTIVDAVRSGAVDYVVKADDPEGMGEAALEVAIRSTLEKGALTTEVARLRAQVVEDPDGTQPCWGDSPAMQKVMTMVDRVADSDVSVLITGESGVGKEVIAREIHRRSPRRPRNFVKVNCAALPAELLESELFGHERGAFTGAQAAQAGKFEQANGGTLLLDEISEMPLALQAKLLHVLQDSAFTKLGSNRVVHVDARVIAATNRSIESMIRAGQFREDLYYRLQVIEIFLPPLRERQAEILPLVEFFLMKYAARYGRQVLRPSARMRQALVGYSWPGNVRELENVMKRYVILQDEALVIAEMTRATSADVASVSTAPQPAAASLATAPAPTPAPAVGSTAAASAAPPAAPTIAMPAADASVPVAAGESATLPALARQAALIAERQAIQVALEHFRWNRRKAAKMLGVSYKTLLNKMKECGITAAPDSEYVEQA